MTIKKLSVQDQKDLIGDEDVYMTFLNRDDIKILPKEEQERRWEKHLVGLNWFRDKLSNIPAIVVEE